MSSTLAPTLFGDATAVILDGEKFKTIDSPKDIGSGDSNFIPGFLSTADADDAFSRIIEEVKFQQWHHMPNKHHELLPLSRLKIALADSTDDEFTPHYRFPVNSQNQHGVFPISAYPTIKAIQNKLIDQTGIKFNHAVVLLYRDGNDCIGFHKDKTLDLSTSDPIASISLGQEREYILRDSIRTPTVSQRLVLNNGSLLLLGPITNANWFHSIPMTKTEGLKPRISITFRVVTTFKNNLTGEIKGQGEMYSTVDWPAQLGGTHIGYYNELLDFWFCDKNTYLGGLWWHGTHPTNEKCKTLNETDNYLKEKWGDILEVYYQKFVPKSDSEFDIIKDSHPLKVWMDTPDGVVALMILFDQFSRNIYRGSAKAFEFDKFAVKLARIVMSDATINLWYKYFAYITFTHSEDAALVAGAIYEIMRITQTVIDEKSKSALLRMTKVFQEHLDVLKKFGRYPHRNEMLHRISTPDEIDFLAKKNLPKWMRPTAKTESTKKTTDDTSEPRAEERLKILVLHSNRQTGQIFKNKTERYLEKKLNTFVNVTYADAPQLYKPSGEAEATVEKSELASVPNVGYTRTWWNASDDPKTMIYSGMDESIEYVNTMFKNTKFDGIIGFSQGGALTGIIAMLVNAKRKGEELSVDISHIEESLKFVAIISGFYCRDVRKEFSYHILEEVPVVHTPEEVKIRVDSIDIPSFHIWGTDDKLVDPWRSKKLSDAFKNKIVLTHPSGHFAKAIKYWPLDQMKEWLQSFVESSGTDGNTIYKEIFTSSDSLNEFIGRATDDEKMNCVSYMIQSKKFKSDDLYLNLTKICGHEDKIYDSLTFLTNNNPDYWKKLIDTDTEFFDGKFRTCMVKLICTKLKDEYVKYYVNKYPGVPSTLCKFAPRHNTKFRETKLHTDVSMHLGSIMNIFDATKDSIDDVHEKRKLLLSYNQYHKVISKLLSILEPPHSKPMPKKHIPRNELEKLLSAPLDDSVLNPKAEPVDVSTPELLAPLYAYLQNDKHNKTYDEMVFKRGTVCSDGRLDLCKQVIGPPGIKDLIKALNIDSLSENPKVKHLLLGNNICGNELGKAIGNFIKSGESALTTWYIAGNNLDVSGIAPICEALQTDSQVKQLWLKRNPIRLSGIYPIVDMLKVNACLEVLDLTNTGLLDEGAVLLLNNLNTTLKYLYLSSNGLTHVTCKEMALHINKSRLRQISFGCNRLCDTGAKFIAAMLEDPECKLSSLEIASAGIGPVGATDIANALRVNKSLVSLNMGFLKSTNDLGEVPNLIGSTGAISFALALEHNSTLRHLDLTYTGIQQAGIEQLAKSLSEKNSTLLYINLEQFGIPHNELSREIIRKTVQKNRERADDSLLNEVNALVFPSHLEEIKSVYRIK